MPITIAPMIRARSVAKTGTASASETLRQMLLGASIPPSRGGIGSGRGTGAVAN